jgi:hypothetical protein|tara:strand:+ start:2849 stop:3262 length:414 start_codon:yes stop_codon:yes gene_type:complete
MRKRLRSILLGLIFTVGLAVPVSAQDTENRSWTVTWLDAVSTDETTSTPMPVNSAIDLGVYVEWSAGTSAGQLVVEEAWDSSYTGTWSTIGTINWSAVSSTDVYHQTGSFRALRVRVNTAIAGGTITVKGIGRPAAQ